MLSNAVSNFSSNEALHYHQLHSKNYSDALIKLSSGKKINDTGDDPSIRSSIANVSRDLHANKDLHSDMNNSKALLISTGTYIDEQINDMSDVKENLTKLKSHNLEESERTQIKLQTRNLLDKIDSTANIANYNNLSTLNGELEKSTFQLGTNSFERIEVKIPSTQTNNLGKVRFETGTRITKAVDTNLTFKINDTEEHALGLVSIGATKGSGIGKVAELINNAKQKIGQQAFFDVTTTGVQEIKEGAISGLTINGILIESVEVEAGDSSDVLINAINAVSARSGVVASKDNKNKLILNSPDGRGIEITASGGLGIAGINDTNAKNYGKLTLVSVDGKRSSINTPELIGLTQTDSFVFSTRDIMEKNLIKDKLSSLGAFPNEHTNLNEIYDSLDNKKVLNSFSFLANNAIDNLRNIKSDINFAVTKLTEAQDRVFDINITLKNSLDSKESIDYAEEIYNKEKFSNLLSSSTYALNNSLSKQKEIMEELFKSVKDS